MFSQAVLPRNTKTFLCVSWVSDVIKRTWHSDFSTHKACCGPVMEAEVAAHSSIFVWRIPGTEEPGGLQSMGSQSQTQLKQLSTWPCTSLSLPLLTCSSLPRFKRSSLPCATLLLALDTLFIHPNQSSFPVVLLQDANNKINKRYSWFSLCFWVPSFILFRLSSQSPYWLSGHEFEQALGDGEGLGSLALLQSTGSQSRTRPSNWTSATPSIIIFPGVTEIRRLAQDHIPKALWSFTLCSESKHCCCLQVPLTNILQLYPLFHSLYYWSVSYFVSQ